MTRAYQKSEEIMRWNILLNTVACKGSKQQEILTNRKLFFDKQQVILTSSKLSW